VLFAAAWTFASPSAAAPGARATVSVAGSSGNPVQSAEVYVDGILECASVPCDVELEPGLRHVEVRDSKGARKSQRVVELQRSERTALHFVLPDANVVVPAAATTADAPISVNALPVEAAAEAPVATASFGGSRPPGGSRYAAPALPAGGAFLNLNSIPISNAVIDGRPVGSTPLIGVEVSAGRHVVTFVHPELGRRSASVEVGVGQRRAVVVRFGPTELDD